MGKELYEASQLVDFKTLADLLEATIGKIYFEKGSMYDSAKYLQSLNFPLTLK